MKLKKLAVALLTSAMMVTMMGTSFFAENTPTISGKKQLHLINIW